MKKNYFLSAAIALCTMSVFAGRTYIVQDGFETSTGWPTNFTISGVGLFTGATNAYNGNGLAPTASGLPLWKNIYAQTTVAANKTGIKTEIVAGQRTGGSGSYVLKLTLPDIAFDENTVTKTVRITGNNGFFSFNTGIGETVAKYTCQVWAKVDAASAKILKKQAFGSDTITLTPTWKLCEGVRYINGTSSTGLGVEFARTGVDQVIYFDDFVVYQDPTSVSGVAQKLAFKKEGSTVFVGAEEDVISVALYSISGAKVLANNENYFSTEGLSKGIYVIEATTHSRNLKSKYIVE